jgi:hypothetical protein
MSKIKKGLCISIICWSSAILFGLWGVWMLTYISKFGPGYSYLLTVVAVMMFGWAFLLVWADRNHVYRKGVFFVTGLVATGLLLGQIYGYYIGVLTEKITIVTGTLLFALVVLFALSYFFSKRAVCPKSTILNSNLS